MHGKGLPSLANLPKLPSSFLAAEPAPDHREFSDYTHWAEALLAERNLEIPGDE